MSVSIMADVWKYSQAEGNARLVLLAIADRANDDGECWPGQKNLAEKCRVSERTVKRCVKELGELGELVVTRRGKNRTNVYRVVTGQFDTSTTSGSADLSPQEVTTLSPQEVTRVSPNTSVDTSVTNSSTSAAQGSKAERDALFDALVENFGEATTRSRKSMYGKAVTELVQAEASPDDVSARCRRLRAKDWSDPTPLALLKHWDALADPASKRTRPPDAECPGGVCNGSGFIEEADSKRRQRCPACQAAMDEAIHG